MTDWFRPGFYRNKTPSASTATLSTVAPVTLDDDINDRYPEETNSRLKASSRVSSFVGSRSETPTIPFPDVSVASFPNLDKPENVYHKPSVDRIAETLKVVMMTQDSMTPIPVRYNGCVLHLLEAYNDMQQESLRTQQSLNELASSHQADIAEFENLASRWNIREAEYKDEIERLENVIANTDDGPQTLSISTRNSLIKDPNERVTSRIIRGVGTIRRNHDIATAQKAEEERLLAESSTHQITHQAAYPTYYESEEVLNKSPILRAPTPEKRISKAFYNRILRSRPSRLWLTDNSEEEAHTPNLEQPARGLTASQLEYLDRQQAINRYKEKEREKELRGSSSTSSSEPISDDYDERQLSEEEPIGLGFDILRDGSFTARRPIVTPSSLQGSNPKLFDQSKETESRSLRRGPKQMSFSFQPGDDDINVLHQCESRGPEQRKEFEDHVGQEDKNLPPSSSTTQEQTDVKIETTETRRPPPKRPALNHYARADRAERAEHSNTMSRDDSMNSVITAVRDNSGRSSAAGSQPPSAHKGRPKLQRHIGSTSSGSSEAVAAAAKAFACATRTTNTSSQDQLRGSRLSQEGGLKRGNVPRRAETSGNASRISEGGASTASVTSSGSANDEVGRKVIKKKKNSGSD